jgi:Protein of unknown function (DUF1320)
MAFLIRKDYLTYLQDAQLRQVTSNDDTLIIEAEKHAISKIRTLLIQKYDVDSELSDTLLYAVNKLYYAGQRVYLDAKLYSALTPYSINDLTLYNGNIYKCITGIMVGEVFNVVKWLLIGAQWLIYNATYPKPLFEIKVQYEQGNEVFYNNKVYVAQTFVNGIYPDDSIRGLYYWGAGTPYSVNSNNINDVNAFKIGDNRSAMLVKIAIDLTIYNIHRRIAPLNVPDSRRMAYQDSIIELEQFGEGRATLEAKTKEEPLGRRARWGKINGSKFNY